LQQGSPVIRINQVPQARTETLSSVTAQYASSFASLHSTIASGRTRIARPSADAAGSAPSNTRTVFLRRLPVGKNRRQRAHAAPQSQQQKLQPQVQYGQQQRTAPYRIPAMAKGLECAPTPSPIHPAAAAHAFVSATIAHACHANHNQQKIKSPRCLRELPDRFAPVIRTGLLPA